MRWLLCSMVTGVAALFLGGGGSACAAEISKEKQAISKAEERAALTSVEEFFSGTVRIEPLLDPKHPDAPFGAAYVTFEPGARTHWHSHPTGQHLVVTSGFGLTGTSDGIIRKLKIGDVLWCPKGVKHWHGASPTTAMTHMALTGTLPDGKNVEWMEPVSDEQYRSEK